MDAFDVDFFCQFSLGFLGVAALSWTAYSFANLACDVRAIRAALQDFVCEREEERERQAREAQNAPRRREVVYSFPLEELEDDAKNTSLVK